MIAIDGFYAVIDRDDPALARTLIAGGGARVLQLRAKTASGSELVALGRTLRAICDELGAALVINDRVDVALAVGADGVHLGQTDLPIEAARRIAGDRLAIGISTHDVAQVEQAVQAGADYLGFGPIFATTTKLHPDPEQGLAGLRAAVTAARGTPIVAIGGIRTIDAPAVYAAGASAICAIQAVLAAPDIPAAARAMGRSASRR
jgi:thiamine-phosphate pyrophosphorylase